MKAFPHFWFEGNLSFDWVKSVEDLHEVFTRYEGHLTPKGILDKATCVSEEYIDLRKKSELKFEIDEFGLKREHRGGKKTLREFLLEHSIEFNF